MGSDRAGGWRAKDSWGSGRDETSAVLVAEDIAEKQALLDDSPDKFFTTLHCGDSPRLLVRLEVVGVEKLRQLVTESWRQAPPEVRADFDQRRSE